MAEMLLQQLDFLYTPSRDVAANLVYFTDALGGRVVFAVEAMGTRVAAVQLTADPPLVLLADHVEGERPILVYRVADLGAALAGLKVRGWQRQRTLEIPHGGDPPRAVLLISNAGWLPDRVVPADPARGGRPLHWTAGLLSAPDRLDSHPSTQWCPGSALVDRGPAVDRFGRSPATCWPMTGVRLTRNRALDYGRVVRCACPGARRSLRAT
jgi:hypothetical protein